MCAMEKRLESKWNTGLMLNKHTRPYLQAPPLNHTRICNVCKDTVGNFNGVVSSWQTLCVIPLCDSPVQLSVIWQGRRPHPHQKILIDEAVVIGVCGVQLVSRPGPSYGLHSTWKSSFQLAMMIFRHYIDHVIYRIIPVYF